MEYTHFSVPRSLSDSKYFIVDRRLDLFFVNLSEHELNEEQTIANKFSKFCMYMNVKLSLFFYGHVWKNVWVCVLIYANTDLTRD